MIVGKDTNPERKLYYVGALILEVIKSSPKKEVDFFDALQLVNEREKVSISLFALAMDWLFLLGAISSNKGRIEKCF